MSDKKGNVIDLLTRQLQAMWSGDERADRWVTEHSREKILSLREPLTFYLVEPLVTKRTCVAYTETDEARDLTHRLRTQEQTLSHDEVGSAATELALDFLWKRSKRPNLASFALSSCLMNFCMFETGQRILNEPAPPGMLRFGGLILYARKRFSGDGDIVCRPFAGHTPEPLSEEDVLAVTADFVETDTGNHPELRKRFPVNKYLKSYR